MNPPRARRHLGAHSIFALLLIVSVALGCKRDAPSASADSAIAPRPLPVEIAGCVEYTVDRTCHVRADTVVRVFVGGASEQTLRVTRGGVPFAPKRATAVEGGARLELVPGSDPDVAVSLEAPDARTALIRFRPSRREPWLDAATASKSAGKLDDAERQLSEGMKEEHPQHAYALGLLGRLELARGKHDRAATLLHASMDRHAQLGHLGQRFDDAFALIYVLTDRLRRYAEARAVLESVRADVATHGYEPYKFPYYAALIASAGGDRRRALALLKGAEAAALRLGHDATHVMAAGTIAIQLTHLGRYGAAADAFRALRDRTAATASACEKALLHNNLGTVLAAEAAAGDAAVASRTAAEARHTFGLARELLAHDCEDDRLWRSAALELGGLALRDGDTRIARAILTELSAKPGAPAGDLACDLLELEGRTALAEGRAAVALRAFERASQLADGAGLTRGSWNAHVGRATALEALGKKAAALDGYARAEELLEHASVLAPLGEGKDAFLRNHEDGTRRYVDLLLADGRTADAYAVVRRARQRIVRAASLADRLPALQGEGRARWETATAAYRAEREKIEAEAADDWKLSAADVTKAREARAAREQTVARVLEEAMATVGASGDASRQPLERPANGELMVAYYRGHRDWLAFTDDGSRVEVAHLGAVSPAMEPGLLAAALLEPIGARLADAKRIRILAAGALRSVDVHVLPFRGAPLFAHAPVTYGLDMGTSSRGAESGESALVVADPAGNLASALEEGEAVRARLKEMGKKSVTLLGAQDADRDAFLRELVGVSALHFAGHGTFAGVDGWESELGLAHGAHVSTADIFALSKVPRFVYLSACEGARSSTEASAETLGLAQAFLAAGSETVIAAVRPQNDRAALRLATRYYGAVARGAGDPALAFREAALDPAADDADRAAASSLRVLVR